MSRKTWIILGVVLLLIAGGGAWYFLSDESDMQSTGQASAAPVYQPLPTDHTFGNAKAKVTVIEYASPTCPVCANFMINMYPRLKKDYIDTGKIFYVYRTFLRNPDDAAAEKLARCMPKDKYMSFTDVLFRNQQKWDYEYGVPSPDGVHVALLDLAAASGMSADAANKCLVATTDDDAISKVGEDGIAKYKVSATPTFVINGEGQAGFEAFFERLDAALAK
jgi:protein-disulfide isomerase